ncbi:ScyD/ScyE family protein [Hymenobacter sp. BT188]|nr:ScyD/ScyE family protein [Hymenobacter sp. BT188]
MGLLVPILVPIALLFAGCDLLEDTPKCVNHAVAPVTTFATGLNNPRGLKFGPDGNLYVAEGGTGGTNSTIGQCVQVTGPVGPYTGSPTGGRVSKISSAGIRTTLTDRFPSSNAQAEIGGDVQGVADVAFIGNTMYALISGAGCSHGVTSMPNGVVRINTDGSFTQIADISAFLMANPVQIPHEGGGFEPDGVPYSMISVGGDLYVIEPNQDQMLKVTTSGTVSRVIDISAKLNKHITPTVVASRGGNFYVSNLGLFPIVQGSSSIYQVTPSGEINVYATGFTTVLGIVFDKQGRLYVLENTIGNPFPTPGTGRVVRINPSGSRETITSGLTLPTGLTIGPDNKLYVSNVGFSPAAAGGGQVLQIDITTCNSLFGRTL